MEQVKFNTLQSSECRRSKLTLIPHISPSHIQQTSPARPSCFSFSSSFFSRAALRVTSAKPWNCEKASAHLLYITCSWVTASQYLTGQQDFKNPKESFLSWISNKSIHISKVSTPEVNHGQIFQKLTVVFKYSIKYGICSTMSWCKLYDFQDRMQQTTSMPYLKNDRVKTGMGLARDWWASNQRIKTSSLLFPL